MRTASEEERTRLLTEPPLRVLLSRLVGWYFDVRDWQPSRSGSWGADYTVEVRHPDGTPYLLRAHCARAPGATPGCGRVAIVADGEEVLGAPTVTSESLWDNRLVHRLVGARPGGRLARHWGDRLLLEPGDLKQMREALSALIDTLEPYIAPQPDPPPLATDAQATRRPRLSSLAAAPARPERDESPELRP